MIKIDKKLGKYYLIRHRLAHGDALTWEGHSPISWLIKKFTFRSHASSVLRQVDAGELRRLIVEADQGEVNIRLLSSKLDIYKGKCFWHPLKKELYQYRDEIARFLWSNVGIKYGYGTLFKMALLRPSVGPKSFICSELTGASYFYPDNLLILCLYYH